MRALFFLLLISCYFKADILKPALTEITFLKNNQLEITFELNLEAVLSGMSTTHNNTQNSPNSKDYDKLRVLHKEELKDIFLQNQEAFLKNISLKINNKNILLSLKDINIDEIGYIKRARKSIITYKTILNESVKTMTWKYNKKYGDNAFRYRIYEENKYTWSDWSWIAGDSTGVTVDINYKLQKSNFNIFKQFTTIGFLHVIPMGLDHILFIIGMALAPIAWRQLLILVTSFTLAHTFTLGLSMLKVIDLSPLIIEPLIAFSIGYIAIENLMKKQSKTRKTFTVFGFGLLHGMGFASMLKAFDMNKDSFLSTLIGFNIGVEIAQILIILCTVAILHTIKRYSRFYKKTISLSSLMIAMIALYWTIDKIEII